MNDNPIQIIQYYFEKSRQIGLRYHNVAVLSTCLNNKPNSRCVLIKEINEKGLVFYTNYKSKKGREIHKNPFVALVFFWEKLGIQIRIRGTAEKIPAEESTKYFKSRPKESQISAYISKQSQKLDSYQKLEEMFKVYVEKFKDKDVDRPPHWGGLIIKPQEIEIWEEKPFRLHKRILFYKKKDKWYKCFLYP
ncbi:MAG: pyridoxamine 5'-phosphate oxidase [Candidatus Calescibacterium sp.]|nr:pyridoxamine 5'-phosphate oxidase [Candidatus Calescibacterium sp.]MDW8132716.1 pyridoxamine 5'-phosphate oxidase [Candidatus Calescibacterium sp.]